MNYRDVLLFNLDKVHTTKMGIERIGKNLELNIEDVVSWCKCKISNANCQITRRGKNYYATIDNYIITINSYSYTIITAHKLKKV